MWFFTKIKEQLGLKSPGSGTTFIYGPLDDHEVRLVVLLPGAFSTQIRCELFKHKLDKSIKYDALSYSWGDTNITERIFLDDCKFEITRGLERALRYLRYPDESRILWIDAMSINQNDDNERNHQVQIMYDIYENAEKVRSWIGCETEPEDDLIRPGLDNFQYRLNQRHQLNTKALAIGSNEGWNIFNLLEAFSKSPPVDKKQKHDVGMGNHVCPAIAETFTTDSGIAAWCKLAIIVSRPYWTRVWIQQEISREEKVLVHFGNSSFPLVSIYNQCLWLQRFSDSCSHHCADFGESFDFYRWMMRLYGPIFFLSLQGTTRFPKRESLGLLLGFLGSLSFKRTTDVKDKIYALVGLVPQWRDGGLLVDYRLSVPQVYTAAVRSVVELHKTLDVITRSFRIPKRASNADLPSWCPDWSAVVHLRGDVKMHGEISIEDIAARLPLAGQNASRGSVLSVSFDNYDQILIASGVQFDIVSTVVVPFGGKILHDKGELWQKVLCAVRLARSFSGGPYWRFWQTQDSQVPPDAEKHIVAAELKKAKGQYNVSEEQIEQQWKDQADVFWSTLIANDGELYKSGYELFRSQEGPQIGVVRASAHKSDLPIMAEDREMNSYDEPISFSVYKRGQNVRMKICSHRRFFMSENGYMGLGSVDIRRGDLVCVLFGCSQPVFLRKVEDHYIFLGPAYIHGWMNGEAVKLYDQGKVAL